MHFNKLKTGFVLCFLCCIFAVFADADNFKKVNETIEHIDENLEIN